MIEIQIYQPCSFPFQYWMLSKTGEIRRDEACLDYAGSDVILYPCHGSKGNQFWTYDHQVIIYLTEAGAYPQLPTQPKFF